MTSAKSTTGYTLGIAQQSSLADEPTTGFDEIRLEADPTLPTDEKMVVAQANLGHENAHNWSDQPVTYEGVRTDAITLPLAFRTGDAVDQHSPISVLAESGGCDVEVLADDPGLTVTDAANFTGASVHGADKNGAMVTVELPDGRYYPTLVNDYVDSTGVYKLQMALPATPAASADIQATETITPKTDEVSAAKLISMLFSSRGDHTGSEDLAYYYRGCALSSFGEIVIEPAGGDTGIIKMSPTFHCAKVEQSNVALAAESFIDNPKLTHTSNNLVVEFGDYLAAGEIVHSNLTVLRATINLNYTSVPVHGTGSTSTVNDVSCYIGQMLEQATVSLEVMMDKAYWADFDDSQVEKHIAFVMPTTSLTAPAWNICLPRCYQSAPPVADHFGSEYIKATLTYAATSPDLGTDLSNNQTGTAPWFIGLMQL